MDKCCNTRLLLEIKQGESRSFRFNIKQSGLPLNLSPYQVLFQVRKSPYLNVTPFIDKVITQELSKENGQIDKPLEGSFYVYISNTDFGLLPPEDYYVSIYLKDETNTISISGEGNSSSIIRFCKC